MAGVIERPVQGRVERFSFLSAHFFGGAVLPKRLRFLCFGGRGSFLSGG